MNTSENDGLVVLAVDDEEPALMELAYLLEQDQRVGTVLRASDSISALRILTGGDRSTWAASAGGTPPTGLPAPAKQSDVDVLFLDIRMPGLDGLELANVLSRYVIPPSVVFVTAHDDRAVEAFDVGAVDYLLKPLRPERLYASLIADPVLARHHGAGRARRRRGGRRRGDPRRARRHHEAGAALDGALGGGAGRLRAPAHHRGQPPRAHPALGARGALVRRRLRAHPPLVPRRAAADHRAAPRRLRATSCAWAAAGDVAELPVSRRHTRELKDRLVRSTKQAWGRR